MNKEIKNWIRGIIESTENCVERMKNNTLSEKDRTSHSLMLVELAQAIRNDTEYASDPVMQDIAGRLLDSFSALTNDNVELLVEKADEIRQLYAHGEILVTAEDRRRFRAREDGRTYIDFLPLMPHEQYLQTVENLKSMGAKYDAETKQWYVEKDWQPEIDKRGNVLQEQRESEMVNERKENPIMNEHENTANQQFKAIYYEGNERRELYAGTKELAVQAVKEAKTGLKETDRCYIQEYNAEADHYEQEGIYLIDSGRDVSPVEIKIPHVAPEAFKEITAAFKDMGVKYSTAQKMWYVERSASKETMDSIHQYIDSKIKFQAVYYDNSERREIYAETKNAAIQAVREAKQGLKENERCYIKELDPQTGKYEQEGIYITESGKDVTPVEFNIPYMRQETFKVAITEIKEIGAKFNSDKKVWYVERSAGEDTINQIKDCLARHDEGIYLKLPKDTTKEQFKVLIGQLKENGARYNPEKKAWYITKETDRSKFAEYLPSEKPSVREKLARNQESAASNSSQKEKTIEPRNKNTHERA